LAAAVKNQFGIVANLIEGHDDIFEVAINDQVIYTNSQQCGRLPDNEEVVQMIREYG